MNTILRHLIEKPVSCRKQYTQWSTAAQWRQICLCKLDEQWDNNIMSAKSPALAVFITRMSIRRRLLNFNVFEPWYRQRLIGSVLQTFTLTQKF